MSRFRSAATSLILGGALSAVAFGAQSGTDLASSTTVSILVALAAGIMLALSDPASARAGLCTAGPASRCSPLSQPSLRCQARGRSHRRTPRRRQAAPSPTSWPSPPAWRPLADFHRPAAWSCRESPSPAWWSAGGPWRRGSGRAPWAATCCSPRGSAHRSTTGTRSAALAAMSVPPVLWIAARRTRPGALAYPAMGVLMLTILLTQSRGALAAAVAGGRDLVRRGAVAAAHGAVWWCCRRCVAAPLAAWALSRDQFTEPFQSVAVQESVAGDFGLMLLAVCVLLLLAGLLLQDVCTRTAPSLRVRRRAGVVLAAIACGLPLVALTSVAVSDRGLGRHALRPPRGAHRARPRLRLPMPAGSCLPPPPGASTGARRAGSSRSEPLLGTGAEHLRPRAVALPQGRPRRRARSRVRGPDAGRPGPPGAAGRARAARRLARRPLPARWAWCPATGRGQSGATSAQRSPRLRCARWFRPAFGH